jgi:FG-GAP repeat
MNKKILIAGFACLSMMVTAQSNSGSGQATAPSKGSASQDVAQGHTSGKRMHETVTTSVAPAPGQNAASNGAATGKAAGNTGGSSTKGGKSSTDDWTTSAAKAPSGNKTGQDDWTNSTAKNSSNGQPRVATGDVNGDGKADVAVSNSSNTKNAKDAASAQPSGKRMHKPVSVTPVSDTTPQK